MYAEVERQGELTLTEAVTGIRERFGEEFAPGGRIRRDVRAAFREQGEAGPVWVGSRKAWRRRNAHDPPRGLRVAHGA